MQLYYFGCSNREGGHYWWGSGWQSHSHPPGIGSPFYGDGFPVDGSLAPRGKRKREDGTITMSFVHGYTVLAWWDQSVDKRSACNSSLWVKGQHPFDVIIEQAQIAFPGLLERQTVMLVCEGPGARLFEDDEPLMRLRERLRRLCEAEGI